MSPTRRRRRPEPLHPPQDPFISDEDMPAGYWDAVRAMASTGRQAAVRYAYVVTAVNGAGGRAALAVFTTPLAADQAAQDRPPDDEAWVELVRLYTSAAEWARDRPGP